MRAESKLKSIELFAGAGGLGLGLSQAGIHPSVLLEADQSCCDTLATNHKRHFARRNKAVIVRTSVADVDLSTVPSAIDVLSGGPPCQPFSYAGRHKGYEDARNLFPEFYRFLRHSTPKAFVVENVPGLLRKSFKEYFEYILLQLRYPEVQRYPLQSWEEHRATLERYHTSNSARGLVYNVLWRLINAADYGIPQTRKRLFIVGVRSDIDAAWTFQKPLNSQTSLIWDKLYGNYWDRNEVPRRKRYLDPGQDRFSSSLSRLEKPLEKPWLTVRDALLGLPKMVPDGRPERLQGHVFRAGAREYRGHSGSTLDEPAKTLKAGVHGVPGGENMMRLDNGALRYFTIRECARLQTFPDDYVICGSWTKSMRQIGNAVPVELARILGHSIGNALTSP